MWKKVLIIVVLLGLIPTYIVAVYALPAPTASDCGSDGQVRGEKVGFCSEVSVSVVRGYYLDTVRLPVNRFGVNLDLVNRLFLPVILVLVALVWRR